jgi:subtilisin family serine protease
MKNSRIFFALLFIITSFFIGGQILASDKNDYIAGEVIVKYKSAKVNLNTASGRLKAASFNNNSSLEAKENFRELNMSVLKIKDGDTVENKIAELKNDSNVEYAEPNYLRYPSAINTNDTYKNNLWGLDNTGQNIGGLGTADADIDAPEAWGISEGNSTVIATIDSGVAYNHPDLINNMWDGANCKDENGNFLGNCNHGYDFIDDDKTPLPSSDFAEYNHGTHIAGIMAAVKNNNTGIIGVAPKAKIMALRFNFSVQQEIRAINFVMQNGVKIIGTSFTGPSFSTAEYDAINRFRQYGGVYVAAASNDSTNNDITPYYPASYNLDNIITVAATDNNDNLAGFSNYGKISVDVGAPGNYIYSTLTGESNLFSDLLTSVTTPNLPTNFVRGGLNNNWRTENNATYGKVLTGELAGSYATSSDTNVTSPAYDLSSSASAYVSFRSGCNTEYADNFPDHMSLEYSSDGGSTFNEIIKWDEKYLAALSGTDINSTSGAVYTFNNLFIPNQYLVSNFKFRLRWVTNGNSDTGDGAINGCWVNSFNIKKLSDGSIPSYGYYAGTSMASPHVSGLVALLLSARPDLTYTQIRDIIFKTGDSLSSLNNKTSTGKRINTFKALTLATYSDSVFPNTTTKKGSNSLEIISSVNINNTIWLAPAGTNNFVEGIDMTKTTGTSTTIITPSLAGNYKLFVVDADNNIAPDSLATLTVDNTPPAKPEINSIATDNNINNSEASNIHVVGTAEANSLVSVTLSDGIKATTTSSQLINNGTNYDLVLDGSDLLDGLIHVSSTVTNSLGNTSLAATSTAIKDVILPIINSVETQDLNDNGKVDAVKIIFSKNINDVTVDANNFDVVGYTGENFLATTTNTNIIYITFNESADLDSSATPTLSYVKGNLKDTLNNSLETSLNNISTDKVAPASVKIGDDLTDVELPVGETNLIFSELLSTSSRLTVENTLTNGADKTLTYNWLDNILKITATATTTFSNDVMASVADNSNNSQVVLLIDSSLTSTQIKPSNTGLVSLSNLIPQAVITNPIQETSVTISSDVSNPTINVSSLINKSGVGTLPAITITSINASNVSVAITTSTVITSASTTWNGIMMTPILSSVALPETSGQTKTLSLAIKLGSTNYKLTFDKGVRILLPGQTGKRVGYLNSGEMFTEITNICANDDQSSGNILGVGSECKINVGADLVIWTKHFTEFATYTQTTNITNSGGSGGGGGGGGGANITYCSAITYNTWQTCIGAQQFRTVLTNTPTNCTLTTAQQLELNRVCISQTTIEPITTVSEPTTNTKVTVSTDKNNLIKQIIEEELELTTKIDTKLIKKLVGRILLQVEQKGQAWYLDPSSLKRYYLADGDSAYQALRKFGLGVRNNDLIKIPVSTKSVLPNNYIITTKPAYSTSLRSKLKGKIVIQTEGHGEAWYINPADGTRYYLANGEEAYQIMRNLSLGLSDLNIHKITVGKW